MVEMLFVHWNADPVLLQLGPVAIRWYSLMFVIGFTFGYYLFKRFFVREGIKTELLDSLLYNLVLATIVGARLGHCLFYQPDYYLVFRTIPKRLSG